MTGAHWGWLAEPRRPLGRFPVLSDLSRRHTERQQDGLGQRFTSGPLLEWRQSASADSRLARSRAEVGEISEAFLVWVGVAFLAAACWGAVVVLNKQVLDYVHPIPVNFFVVAVSVASLVAVAVPLSLLHLWPLGFAMTWAAVGYIAAGGAVTWLIAFSAYYYALRSGRVSVVVPLTSTDPLFTAVFAALIVGATIAGLTIAGLIVTFAGVALISRWMGDEPEPHAPALEGASGPALRTSAATVVVLSLVTAAGWGFSPVMIELAERSAGGASTTMMVLGEGLGVVLLAPFVFARRASLSHRAAAGSRASPGRCPADRSRRPERALRRLVVSPDRPHRTGVDDAHQCHLADLRHPRRHGSSCANASAPAWRSARPSPWRACSWRPCRACTEAASRPGNRRDGHLFVPKDSRTPGYHWQRLASLTSLALVRATDECVRRHPL